MDLEIGRNFGFTLVLWEIEDCCLRPEKTEWNLISSEFCVGGSRLTKWQLILRRCFDLQENDLYYLRLQSLGWENYDGEATIDCNLEYPNDVGADNKLYSQCQLRDGGLHDILLNRPGLAPKTSMHTDPFVLKCRLLVSFTDVSESIPFCENKGIRRLIIDMQSLYDGEGQDVFFTLSQDTELSAHKAILHHRVPNAAYRDEFTNANDNIKLDFPYEAVENVFRFLYTGNLKPAVVPPSVATFKFADLLHVKPIVKYYAPDEVTIASTFEAEEFSSSWTIKNFLDRNDKVIESPQMTNKTMDTKWCLRVSLAFKHFVGLSLYMYSNKPKYVCVHIFVNKVSEGRKSLMWHKAVEGGAVLGHREALERDSLADYMSNDSLTVNLRLRMIPTGKETTTSIGDAVSCHKRSLVQINYKCLSNDILSLFQESSYHDMTVNFYEHNVKFDVHRYFILERCTALHDAFRRADRSYFRGMNIVVIRELFHYLYSGTIHENLSIEDIFTLFAIGYRFNFVSLNTVLLERLEESLNESNAREIYNFAIDKNIEILRDAARVYITEDDLNE